LSTDLIEGEVQALGKRGISEETCRKFGYKIGTDKNGKTVQLAPYYDGNELVAQKVRYANKDFKFIGEPKRAGLFGQQLWGTSGKMIVITEGEIDCMSVSQLQGNKWPVVSIPLGAQAAKKVLQKHIEYLEGFDSVVLMFDMDKPGLDAVAECAPLFSPGKCKVASLPLKDANECLQAGNGSAVINAIWQAKPYRPDGLVSLADLREEIEKDIVLGYPWFLPELTAKTYGRRLGEIVALGAGTGVGKTDFITQQAIYDITVLQMQVGCIFLEQKPVETGKRLAGKLVGKRFHVPNAGWTKDELRSALDAMGDRVTFYDSFGQTDWEVVAAKIRYMAISQGIQLFYLDHLTAMADTADEKGSIEQIMKELAGIANELNIWILFVSHLSTPEGKSHEEGGRVTIKNFKGSRAIGFWSHFMFGIERDQQAEDEEDRGSLFRVLKDRYTGQATGFTLPLGYDTNTGMLSSGEPSTVPSSGASRFNFPSEEDLDIPF